MLILRLRSVVGISRHSKIDQGVILRGYHHFQPLWVELFLRRGQKPENSIFEEICAGEDNIVLCLEQINIEC